MGKKLGEKLSIKTKNLPIFQTKKRNFRPKKQAGAELKKKKKNFLGQNWGKNWGKIGNNVQKLTNFKEKKGLFRPKKTSWG